MLTLVELAHSIGFKCFYGVMIKEYSSTQMPQTVSKFEVGSVHENRTGAYEIIAIKNPHVRIRYQDGTETVCNLSALRRIEANILSS